ncbi:MAG: flagellar biosynthesis anti-sigma factor FlgM [Chromatiales bacterium]|jgi:negative regulator of flagellin synthesis FlgM
MAVKISSLSSGNLTGLSNNDAIEHTNKASNAHSSDPKSTDQGDTVSLTGTAAQLQQLENRITKMPVVDAQLVKEVQHKLATGSFLVDPESSATKLLTLETSLS